MLYKVKREDISEKVTLSRELKESLSKYMVLE